MYVICQQCDLSNSHWSHFLTNTKALLRVTLDFLIKSVVAQWLRRCATNRKVAGSIPDDVIGIFH